MVDLAGSRAFRVISANLIALRLTIHQIYANWSAQILCGSLPKT